MSHGRLGRVTLIVAASAVTIASLASGRPAALEESDLITAPAGDRSTATTIWFQGFLADDTTGDPVNATYSIVARIYSAAGGGTLLWGPETHAGVTITEGWFNIELGSIVSPLPSFAAPPYYLSLQVNGEYLTPRLKLASVPSAIQSGTADLVPFSATYAGSSNGITLTHSGTGGEEGLYLLRDAGAAGAYTIYARNDCPSSAVMRGYQYSTAASTNAPVLLLEIGRSTNLSPVVRAATTGIGPAYYGTTDGLHAIEVYADASEDSVASGDAHVIHAVYDGESRGTYNVAVYGEALDDEWGAGGEFVGAKHGVIGTARPSATGHAAYGVYGEAFTANDEDNIGVYGYAANGATNYAGQFLGNVDVDGTLTKNAGSFKIDHPLDPANMYLSHSFVESPDMMNIYNGNVELDAAGEAWVELPGWFEALNRDFRYQLTCVGAFAPVYVADEISGNRFRIAGGSPGTRVSWLVTGVRHDPYAEAHRIPVEEVKSAREQGRYRNPELYGMPVSTGVLYDEDMVKRAEGRPSSGGRKVRPEAPDGVDPDNQ